MDRRMVALLDVLERTGRLVPVDARAGLLLGGPRLDSSGTAAASASPLPPIESYRHLLLDRFLPPVGDAAAPGTAGAAAGARPAGAEMTDRSYSNADCFEAAQDVGSGVHVATTKKLARGGRGRRTKAAASSRKERPGRGRATATATAAVATATPSSRGSEGSGGGGGKGQGKAGPARNDGGGRPPSLGAYLAGLDEARLKRASIQRRALEREEGYGLASASALASATANGVHVSEDGTMRPNDMEKGNENIVGFDARGAAPKGRGDAQRGHPQTLATDNDGDNLAPKHCFGRKWLYELVCEPTGTATGGSGTVVALVDASSKGNAGPAKKKKRRRVLGAAPPPKTGGSALGGGTARTATSTTTTTVGKDVVDHRICIRCRHCRDGRDCLRPSSLSDTHFYNLVVFWANNHYERCEAVPAALRARYDEAKASKARGRKSYWTSEAHAIGLRNVVDRDGRIGSGVAFAPAVRDSAY